jgi:uncharacterized protein YggE
MLRVLLAAAVVLGLHRPAQSQEMRSISASGEAVVYVTPDEVIVHIGVETFAEDLPASKARNDSLSRSLVAAIRALGVEQKHIQTADLEVEIRYHASSQPTLTIEGFIARRAYAITLTDVSRFEALVDAAIANGANRLMGFEYRTTELRRHRDEARRMAVRAAKEKAELLATELGAAVDRPRSISEGDVGYFGWTSARWGMTNAWVAQNSAQAALPVAPGGETMPLGRIGIRASVHVVFDLDVSARE